MQIVSPYHLYNLRRNPFGELTLEERAELAVVDVDQWRGLLTDDRYVLQFIGPCGHGKTTHLLAIQRIIPAAGYIYLPEIGPRPTVADHRPMIVDEAQRLSFWQLRRVLKQRGPLVFGTHVDLSKAIRRAKLIPQAVEVAADSSSEKLVEILNRRIESSRFSDGSIPRISDAHAVRLRQEYGSNIRAIEHQLYEQFQRCALEQITWPPANLS